MQPPNSSDDSSAPDADPESSNTVMHDSVVGGNVHTGDVIHIHHHASSQSPDSAKKAKKAKAKKAKAKKAAEEKEAKAEPSSPEIAPQVMVQTMAGNQQLVGQVSAQPMMMGGMPDNVIMVQQPSDAPKIIGIICMVSAGLGLLSTPFGLLPQYDPVTGERLFIPVAVIAINMVTGIVGSILTGIGGYWLSKYQRRGVHLLLLSIAFSYILSLISASLGGDGGLGSIFGDEAAFAIIAGSSTVCNGICGLIVAIPLMISNNGLDDSSLIPK